MYHQVGNFKRIKSHRATFCRYSRFKTQMAYFKAMGYCVMGLSEGFRRLKEGLLPRRSIILTFDDGYADFYYLVAPLLRKYGFGATVFVLGNMIGKSASWLRDLGYGESPLLDAHMIKALSKEGIEFGSHGMNHLDLTEITEDELEEEVFESKRIIENITNTPVRSFCYPYGRFNESVLEMVKKADYEMAVTCERGRATSQSEPYLLPRIAVSFGDSLAGLLWKIYVKAKPVVSDET